MRKVLFLLFIVTISCNGSVEKNKKLVDALNNTKMPMRGTIAKIPNAEFRLDYYDVFEKDSCTDKLMKMNYQSGGYSWEGIVYGAIKLSDENLLDKIRFDPENDGLAIWSKDEDSLKKIGRLIAVLKSDGSILKECIRVAESNFKME